MAMGRMAKIILKYVSITTRIGIGIYAVILGLLMTPFFQTHVAYLHKIQMTWFKNLNVPETWGFLHNQVTPFFIHTPDGQSLHAWHVLPVELYRKHEQALIKEPSGVAPDFTSRLALKLLREDPEARLVLIFHGAAGTVGSDARIANYRALSAGSPSKIHVLTFDYRGFGKSSSTTPSEYGLMVDSIAVVDWAMQVVGIPPSRILIFGQSLGTAVSLAVMGYFSAQDRQVVFAGTVLVAPFVDVATLAATFRVASKIPILSPLARFSMLLDYLRTFIHDKWLSKDCIARYVQANEANGEKYQLTVIHAEYDPDVPSHHSQTLFWYAVNTSV